jgi:hypothetical protein
MEESGCVLNLDIVQAFGQTEVNQAKSPLGFPVEIRTWQLLNTSQKHYRYGQLA